MSPFGHRSEPSRERTAEERERERLERERRRAERRGEAAPSIEETPLPSPSPGGDGPGVSTLDDAAALSAPVGAPAPSSAPQIAKTRSGALAHAAARPFARPSPRADGEGRHGRLPPMPHLRRPGGGEAPQRRGRRRLFGGVALFVVAVVIWFLVSLFQPFHGGGSGTVAVNVPRGASARSIGDLLARDHVVSSGFFFSLRATLAGKRGSFHAGEFVLKRDMSYGAALDALTKTRAAVSTTRVLVPEGYTRAQIAALARADGLSGDYLHASTHNGNLDPRRYGAPRHESSLEGFLYPATYDLSPGAPAKRLVSLQLAAFKRNFATIDLSYPRHKKLTAYDVLTIASMVEREAALASERPLIAAVIYNRLHLRMPLGIDATIRYALNDYTRPLTASQLASPSPYNTRLHLGLPPTPIGNPGLASIAAAAHPAHVPYLYYVVKPGTCGQDAFSSTNAQFQRDVSRYNSARARAGGRSPTSCH